jgi:hypothetical protein
MMNQLAKESLYSDIGYRTNILTQFLIISSDHVFNLENDLYLNKTQN